MGYTDETHRRALLLLADSINNLATALEQIKPEARMLGNTLLGGSYESSIADARRSLQKMLETLQSGG